MLLLLVFKHTKVLGRTGKLVRRLSLHMKVSKPEGNMLMLSILLLSQYKCCNEVKYSTPLMLLIPACEQYMPVASLTAGVLISKESPPELKVHPMVER